jgi:serine/threonine protein kinase
MPFAAKYVKLGPLTGISRRINHEIEKQTMKGMADHENVVKYKLAINLGAVKVMQNIVNPRHDFNSYDRMFIIMEWADQGTLKQFIDQGRVNDMYATIFTMQLCAGRYPLNLIIFETFI